MEDLSLTIPQVEALEIGSQSETAANRAIILNIQEAET